MGLGKKKDGKENGWLAITDLPGHFDEEEHSGVSKRIILTFLFVNLKITHQTKRTKFKVEGSNEKDWLRMQDNGQREGNLVNLESI